PRPCTRSAPDGGGPGDPLRHRLVGEHLALSAGDGAQQPDPVADLLAAVAAVTLDVVPGQARERIDVAARDLVEHPVIPLGVDASRLGRAHPAATPAARGDA